MGVSRCAGCLVDPIVSWTETATSPSCPRHGTQGHDARPLIPARVAASAAVMERSYAFVMCRAMYVLPGLGGHGRRSYPDGLSHHAVDTFAITALAKQYIGAPGNHLEFEMQPSSGTLG
jgi:hypothetical protein